MGSVNNIGFTNLGLRSTYQPIFATDSLNTMGGRVIEREQNPTAVSDIRGCTLYVLGNILMYNENISSIVLGGGTVEMQIGTVTAGPSAQIFMTNYVANSADVGTIKLTWNAGYGNTFVKWSAWDGSIGNTLSTNNSADIFLTNTDLTSAANIVAVFN